jgi:hypothetical protein
MAVQPPNPGLFNAGAPGIDTDQVNQLLKPYGVSMPSSYQQPGPFENMPGFNSGHPGLSRGLDNAFIALAGMGPTGRTAGENISNVARGVLGIGSYRRQYQAEQAMMPLQFAKEIGGLQQQQATIDELRGRGEYYKAMGQYRGDENQTNILRGQMNANTRNGPGNLQLGTNGKVQERQMGKDGNSYWQDTEIDPQEFKAEHARTKLSNRFPGLEGMYIGNALANHYGGADKVPDTIPDDIMSKVMREGAALTPGYQSGVQKEGAIPAADAYNKFLESQTDAYKGFIKPFQVDNPEKEIAAEKAKWMAHFMNNQDPTNPNPPHQTFAAIDAQAQAQAEHTVREKISKRQAVDAAYGQWSAQPPAAKQALPFAGWMQQRGFDPVNGTFGAAPGQQAPSNPAAGPTPQATGPQLTPKQEAFTNKFILNP